MLYLFFHNKENLNNVIRYGTVSKEKYEFLIFVGVARAAKTGNTRSCKKRDGSASLIVGK